MKQNEIIVWRGHNCWMAIHPLNGHPVPTPWTEKASFEEVSDGLRERNPGYIVIRSTPFSPYGM